MIPISLFPRVFRLLILVTFFLFPISPAALAEDGVFFDEEKKKHTRKTTPKPRRPFLIDLGSWVLTESNSPEALAWDSIASKRVCAPKAISHPTS